MKIITCCTKPRRVGSNIGGQYQTQAQTEIHPLSYPIATVQI